jgi:hypothetical protein
LQPQQQPAGLADREGDDLELTSASSPSSGRRASTASIARVRPQEALAIGHQRMRFASAAAIDEQRADVSGRIDSSAYNRSRSI